MFWKKKNGYEDYNGGDYIRPSEEYRADCEEYHEHGQTYSDFDSRVNNEEYRTDCSDHAHGQTYSDFDSRVNNEEYRTDCSDHAHGQTYPDFNSEQKSYDAQSELEGRFSGKLISGEYIIWCGKSEKNARGRENGGGGCLPAVIIALLFFPPIGIFGLIVYLISMAGIRNRTYAITNKGVLILKNNTLNRIPLRNIRSVTYNSSDRNIGCVMFTTDAAVTGSTPAASEGIYAVKEPMRVATILKKAMSDCR